MELAFRARKLDHPRSTKVGQAHTSRHLGTQHHGQLPEGSRLGWRMDHWTTCIPATMRTTTAILLLLQLLYEPGRTHSGSPSQLKVISTTDRQYSNQKPSIGQDKSQDGPTRTSHRPTSTAFFQSCRFSTIQNMSQDGLTRMPVGATGPTRLLPKLAAPLRTELWREALRRG